MKQEDRLNRVTELTSRLIDDLGDNNGLKADIMVGCCG